MNGLRFNSYFFFGSVLNEWDPVYDRPKPNLNVTMIRFELSWLGGGTFWHTHTTFGVFLIKIRRCVKKNVLFLLDLPIIMVRILSSLVSCCFGVRSFSVDQVIFLTYFLALWEVEVEEEARQPVGNQKGSSHKSVSRQSTDKKWGHTKSEKNEHHPIFNNTFFFINQFGLCKWIFMVRIGVFFINSILMNFFLHFHHFFSGWWIMFCFRAALWN